MNKLVIDGLFTAYAFQGQKLRLKTHKKNPDWLNDHIERHNGMAFSLFKGAIPAAPESISGFFSLPFYDDYPVVASSTELYFMSLTDCAGFLKVEFDTPASNLAEMLARMKIGYAALDAGYQIGLKEGKIAMSDDVGMYMLGLVDKLL